jgi:hypothetical protein
VNATNLLVGNYNITGHNAYKGLQHGWLNHVLELAGVLYQPHAEPNVRTARKQKSTATVPALASKKVTEKRRHMKGSSCSEDQTSMQELMLAKPLKQSKKFISHSSWPSSAGGSGRAQALDHVLDLFDSGSSTFGGETANLAPPQKHPQKSPVLKNVPMPCEALATKGTLE